MSDLRHQLQSTLGAAYSIERELGGGGMSRVFVAEETAFGRRVVVKLLAPELVAGVNVDRFKREIQLAAKLQHPHIVPVITAGESGGLPFYTMPFVEGESLRARLGRSGQLPIGDAIAILRDVAKALAYAHERGIVHRDIKPDNVLLAGGSATVADFGIAKAIAAAKTHERGATLTQIGTSIGTPMYMAPEQAAGDPDVDYRADIYSFGCMAYEMLTGRPPFVAKTPQRLLAAHMGEKPQPIASLRPDVPAALADVITRCLEKEPSARPQSVADMIPLLEATTSGDRTVAPGLLLGAPGMLPKVLLGYALSVVAVAILARAATIALGLPDWVFPAALIVMGLGLPAILFTGYAQRVARRAFTDTPTYTPGGTPSMQHGTMATIALKASPHLSWRRTTRWGAYALGVFVLAVGAAMLMRTMGIGPFATLLSAGTLKSGDNVLVAEFTIANSADTSLGRVIADAVKNDLEQSAAITVVSDADVAQSLALMQRPGARLLLPVAREVAERRGAKAIVDGSLNALGNGFVVKVRLVSADSGKELASFTSAADSPSQLIDVVGELSKKLRAKLGESLKSVRSSPALAEATTSSLPALRKFTEARRVLGTGRDRATFQRLMREAIELDSTFALAYYGLAIDHANRGERADAARRMEQAYRLRGRMSDRERLVVEWFYFREGPAASRNTARSEAAFDSSIRNYPNNRIPSGALQVMGLLLRARGEFKRADSALRRAVAFDTTNLSAINNLIGLQLAVGVRPAVESSVVIMTRRFPSNAGPRVAILQLDSGNVRGAERTLKALLDTGHEEAAARAAHARGLATIAERRGALREADRWAALDTKLLPVRAGRTVALDKADAAADARVQLFGDTAGARLIMDAALAKTPIESMAELDRPYAMLASAYAQAGRPDKAKRFLESAAKTQPEDDPTFGYTVSIPRAEVAMAERKWDDAIRILRGTMPGRCPQCLYRMRAAAFDGAQQRDSAVYWYEQYLNTMGLFGYEWVLAQRRLGELYADKGDIPRALAHYQKLVESWKEADPELQPQVAEVKQRISRLQQQERRGR